ncbi:MAG: hypothetical protein DDT19_01449 [Syntrophomonadaceae bacterium]|nr:hypothetical protein [Bacillota bacterium]
MPKQKFTVMRSVSFTEEQDKALIAQAAAEGRKAGNLIRLAMCKYLRDVGKLLPQDSGGDFDGEE